MRRTLLAGLSAAALVVSFLLVLAPSAGAAPPGHGFWHRHERVCTFAPSGQAACNAIRNDTVDSNGRVVRNVAPSGLTPANLQSAYNLPVTSLTKTSPTVAVVDAYDDPYAESDLGVYRKQWGLPACTTANGCFKKVNQNGLTRSLPRANASWAQEISLDLDMVSAACPGCKILLVEAQSASFRDLGAAVNQAAKLGAVAISNSYGGSDTNDPTVLNYYNHPNIAITASTGDSGYGVQAPASFNTVVAVGGTSLYGSGTTWNETAWSGAGSGCSTLNPNVTGYQDETATGCAGHKANADVSAVADPSTGVAVYDSYAYGGARGWLVFGGTSAASPIIAGVYAMGGNLTGYPARYTWQYAAAHPGALHDVSAAVTNGSCDTTAWCTSGTGWDGLTGLGTPNGTAGF